MTQIGQLNTRVTIQQPTFVADSHGGRSVTWHALVTVWAKVAPITGREALLAQQMTAVLSTTVTIWFRDDITATQRVVVGTRTLQIESYQDPTGRGSELLLLCSEVQA